MENHAYQVLICIGLFSLWTSLSILWTQLQQTVSFICFWWWKWSCFVLLYWNDIFLSFSFYLVHDIKLLLICFVIDGSYNPTFNKWTLCPSLNPNKGSLTVVSLTKQIRSVADGVYGINSFVVIEVLDLEIGRWVSASSKLHKVKYDSMIVYRCYTTVYEKINSKCSRCFKHDSYITSFNFSTESIYSFRCSMYKQLLFQ